MGGRGNTKHYMSLNCQGKQRECSKTDIDTVDPVI